MSPIGGVGINHAIQDAVGAANVLAPALCANRFVDDARLEEIQQRRLLPTKLIQTLQLQIQNRLITKVLRRSQRLPHVPVILR
jgi:2-polyprenyl-6-methoxyphenol hydroxylase-like FAD-dependent oxidoreductase